MPVLTYIIIAITTLASIIGFSNSNIFEKNVFSVGAILKKGEIYRLVTSQLIHVNIVHLFFNMFSFYSFSSLIETRFGLKIIAVIYLYSALGAGLLSLLIKRKNHGYRAVGASGAVSGIIFSSIFLIPGTSIQIFPIPIPIPSWLFAIIFMGISLFGIGRGSSIIGHEAHMGGALTGIGWAVLYRPSIIYDNYILLAGTTVPVILILIFFIAKENISSKKKKDEAPQ